MLNRKHYLVPALVAMATATTHAQSVTDAYNLSNLTVQGTARSMGFGNALGSIGADFSTLSVNPAGIGVYRSSEMSLTPSLRINNSSSQYINTTTADNNVRFNFNNFGIVFTNAPKGKRYEKRAWKAVSFGIGMNRVADFNRNYSYRGVNTSSSATQVFESDANQYDVSTLNSGGYLGFEGYLLDPDASGQYASVVPFRGGINQAKTMTERGRINEYVFSLGGNYRERLMLGATLGIPDLEYNSRSFYSETVAPGNTSANPANFSTFAYEQGVSLSGIGVNVKLGAIYRVTDFLRVGGAFHSPTIYAITDIYNPSLTSIVGNTQTTLSVYNNALAQNQFDYSFSTPWRGILSAALVLKGIGFVTADYEFVNYRSARYYYPLDVSPNTNFTQQEADMNQNIRNTYQSAQNVRIGLEALVTKYFMARAGFGYYGNPYASGTSGQRLDISAGLGFHFRHFFTDLAVVHSTFQRAEQPYSIDYNYVISGSPAVVPTATTDFGLSNIAWTIGVKF